MPGCWITRAEEPISRRLAPTTRNTRRVTVLVPFGIPIAMRRPERRALRRETRRWADRLARASRGAARSGAAVFTPPGKIVPLPVSGTLWGLAAASLVMSSTALRVPDAPGRNFRPIVHEPPGATGPRQPFLLTANSPALAPEIAAPEMFSD